MRGRLALFFSLACLLVTGCTPPPASQEIRFAIAQGPITLDPRYATDAASERVNRLLYRSLVDFDAHSRPVPSLAAWQVSDPLHYRFTLGHSGRLFHDGSRLTSRDVATTYGSLLALKDAPHAAEFANIVAIKVVDDDVVDFTLKIPDPDFPARLILGILPQRLIEAGHDFSRYPVGSGPLKMVEWNRLLRLERLGDHQPIVLEEVKDPTVRVLKLLRGEVDLLQGDLPPELLMYLRRQPGIEVRDSPGANFSYLGFNLRDPLLNKPEVRRAVALSIDRAEVIRQVLIGGSRPASAILPPEHWAGNPDLKAIPYDPVLARALLKQAGVTLPLKLVMKTSTDPQRVRLATLMQAQLKSTGIELEIRSLDWGTFFDDVRHGKFQLYSLTWVGIRTPEIYRLAFHSASVPPAGANRGYLRDVELDTLLDQRDWRAVTARVDQLLPYVPLWYEGQFSAMRKELSGYAPASDGNWDGLLTVMKRKQG